MAVDDPTVIELREWSRIAEELAQERNRLANRIRQQLWRYYPQMLQVADDLAAENFLAPWELAPTPAHAVRIDEASLAKVLKAHRVRRISAAAAPHQARRRTGAIGQPPDQGSRTKARDALRSTRTTWRRRTRERAGAEIQAARRDGPALLAGGGKDQPRRAARRGRRALASPRLSGPAGLVRRRPGHPPQRQGGLVSRRSACNERLREAVYHWARVAMQTDPECRQRYAALRRRGKSHGRALRTLGDRLLAVACAMLTNQPLYDSNYKSASPAAA
jgi:hypothetical protein